MLDSMQSWKLNSASLFERYNILVGEERLDKYQSLLYSHQTFSLSATLIILFDRELEATLLIAFDFHPQVTS